MATTRILQDIGGFEILGELGHGGMGIVYRARDNTLQRELAIKVQSGDWRKSPERLKRFLREARILAQINHPNVVQIYSVGEHEGAPFFAMELLEGSVADAARLKRPAIAQLKRWMLEAARGLAAIHEMDVVHRDIKPGNLLLTRPTSVEDEHVKVADLGIARAGEQFGGALTRSGAVLGTSGYLPPESFRLEYDVDGRADQYSLGVVFFELLAGRAPYDDMGDMALMSAILEPRNPPDVRTFRPEVDAATAEVLARMLRDDPEQRYQSTAELVKALAQIQGPALPASAPAPPNAVAATAPIPPPMPLAKPSAAPAPAGHSIPSQPAADGKRVTLQRFLWAGIALAIVLAALFFWRERALTPTAAVSADATDPLQREAWAKYLLGRYPLESKNDQEHWTLDLIDQNGGVIDAELGGPEDAPIELSGRVESYQTRRIDGEDWFTYRVKLAGPADVLIDIELVFSEDTTDGSGTLVYYGDREQFTVLGFEEL